MNTFLAVFLLISLIINYILATAYIEQNRKYAGYDEFVKELEKTFGGVERLVTKYKKQRGIKK
jgi:hypothetical protein